MAITTFGHAFIFFQNSHADLENKFEKELAQSEARYKILFESAIKQLHAAVIYLSENQDVINIFANNSKSGHNHDTNQALLPPQFSYFQDFEDIYISLFNPNGIPILNSARDHCWEQDIPGSSTNLNTEHSIITTKKNCFGANIALPIPNAQQGQTKELLGILNAHISLESAFDEFSQKTGLNFLILTPSYEKNLNKTTIRNPNTQKTMHTFWSNDYDIAQKILNHPINDQTNFFKRKAMQAHEKNTLHPELKTLKIENRSLAFSVLHIQPTPLKYNADPITVITWLDGTEQTNQVNHVTTAILIAEAIQFLVFSLIYWIAVVRSNKQRYNQAKRQYNQAKRQYNQAKMHSETDQLTQLPNRRAFDAHFDKELNRAVRDKSPLGVIILDIDHFKNYNDDYGHLQGDECLKLIGEILAKSLTRASDFFARWGGEEFAILLPNLNTMQTVKVAEYVRKAIVKRRIPHKGNPLGIVTASFGASSVKYSSTDDSHSVLNLADQALYAAKKTRNHTCYKDVNKRALTQKK